MANIWKYCKLINWHIFCQFVTSQLWWWWSMIIDYVNHEMMMIKMVVIVVVVVIMMMIWITLDLVTWFVGVVAWHRTIVATCPDCAPPILYSAILQEVPLNQPNPPPKPNLATTENSVSSYHVQLSTQTNRKSLLTRKVQYSCYWTISGLPAALSICQQCLSIFVNAVEIGFEPWLCWENACGVRFLRAG